MRILAGDGLDNNKDPLCTHRAAILTVCGPSVQSALPGNAMCDSFRFNDPTFQPSSLKRAQNIMRTKISPSELGQFF